MNTDWTDTVRLAQLAQTWQALARTQLACLQAQNLTRRRLMHVSHVVRSKARWFRPSGLRRVAHYRFRCHRSWT